MLARAGLTFRDLDWMARDPKLPPGRGRAAGAGVGAAGGAGEAAGSGAADDEGTRREVRELKARVRELEDHLQKAQADLVRQRQETRRWHELARETAEHLWDLGKALERTKSRITVTDRRRALIECLRDPVTALWTDQEIRRRLGVAVHTVAWWRRHLSTIDRTRHLARTRQKGRHLYRSIVARTIPDGMRRG